MNKSRQKICTPQPCLFSCPALSLMVAGCDMCTCTEYPLPSFHPNLPVYPYFLCPLTSFLLSSLSLCPSFTSPIGSSLCLAVILFKKISPRERSLHLSVYVHSSVYFLLSLRPAIPPSLCPRSPVCLLYIIVFCQRSPFSPKRQPREPPLTSGCFDWIFWMYKCLMMLRRL